MKKKLYIKTYGCQMNEYDSMRIEDIMSPLGYTKQDSYKDADLVILNTCNIREKAAEKVYSELGRIKIAKNKKQETGGKMIVTIAGCVGQAEGEEIFNNAPFVDIVVGSHSYTKLPEMVNKINSETSENLLNLDLSNNKFDNIKQEITRENISAYLPVQEGCDKFCKFCVVPYTRGAEYSRSISSIYREALEIASKGTKEIILVGQNVNAFHGKDYEGNVWDLGQLIDHISKIKGIERIRYTTPHPIDMHENLYNSHANNPKLPPFLGLPVQSGSNKILKSMNRKYDRDFYLEIVKKFRDKIPNFQFGSDFIIGFPGETEQDFEDTLDIAEKVNFIQAFSFKYSPRPGTPGAEMKNQIDEEVKVKRLEIFQKLIEKQQKKFYNECIGKVFSVLFTDKGKYENQLRGKTPYAQPIHINSGDLSLIGKVIDIKVIKANYNNLEGEIA